MVHQILTLITSSPLNIALTAIAGIVVVLIIAKIFFKFDTISSTEIRVQQKQQTVHLPSKLNITNEEAEELSQNLPQLQLELKEGKEWTAGLSISALAATSKVVATIQKDAHIVLLYRSEQFDHALNVAHKSSVRHNAIIDLGGQEFPNCVALSPNSERCVVSMDFNHRLRMFSLALPPSTKDSNVIVPIKVTKTWKQDSQPHYRPVSQIEFTANGKTIVSATRDEDRVYVWDAATGNLLLRYNLGQLQTNMISLSPTGKYLAAATFTSTLKIYELTVDEQQTTAALKKYADLNIFKLSIQTVSFKNDDLLVATSKDGTLKIVNTTPIDYVHNVRAKETDAILYSNKIAQEKDFVKAQYSPFNNVIATIAPSAGANNKTCITFYKTPNNIADANRFKKHAFEKLFSMKHPCNLIKLVFLDAQRFITAGEDGITRVYQFNESS